MNQVNIIIIYFNKEVNLKSQEIYGRIKLLIDNNLQQIINTTLILNIYDP